MLKHRPIQNHYDFELEAGIAKHCLGQNRRYTILTISALDFVSRQHDTVTFLIL